MGFYIPYLRCSFCVGAATCPSSSDQFSHKSILGLMGAGPWGDRDRWVISIAHLVALFHLQQYYAERVEVQPEHQVINPGPYALVRHPVITSFFGISTGLFFINPALTTLAALLYTLWDFGRAARQEEELLTQTLPGYSDYARQTPRFLPRLWRSR